MAPDFTTFVLETLFEDWRTDVVARPELVDRRNTSRIGPRAPDQKANLTANNVIGVGAGPTTNQQPTGFDFQYRYDGGADVRIRGMPTTESGHVASIEEWNAIVGEARRCIHEKRRWPIPEGGAYTAAIPAENDNSQDYQDQYLYQFDVIFQGIERLP